MKLLEYFFINKPELERFYLLPKIHKGLHNVPGRPVISNSDFFTENISAFLEHHLKTLSQKVKSFIKDTNNFLKRLNELWDLPDDFILCTIHVVGLYPNIPHKEGLEAIRKALDKREDQTISTDSLILLAECILKNNVFKHNMRYFKQLNGTAIGTELHHRTLFYLWVVWKIKFWMLFLKNLLYGGATLTIFVWFGNTD